MPEPVERADESGASAWDPQRVPEAPALAQGELFLQDAVEVPHEVLTATPHGGGEAVITEGLTDMRLLEDLPVPLPAAPVRAYVA